MPLPLTRIIPHGWSQHHAKSIPTSFSAVVICTVDPVGEPQRDPDTGAPITLPRPVVYAGAARVQKLDRTTGDAKDATDRPVLSYPYLLQLEAWVDAVVGMKVEVTSVTPGHDPKLVGLILWCAAINHSSESFTRDIWCDTEQTGPR